MVTNLINSFIEINKMAELSIGEVYKAQMVLKDVARHPKIIVPVTLIEDCSVYLKPENLQYTG